MQLSYTDEGFSKTFAAQNQHLYQILPCFVNFHASTVKKAPSIRPTSSVEAETLAKVLSNLNKLTDAKFDRILQKILALNLDSLAVLDKVAEKIIQKAMDEPTYGALYAKLCSSL